MQNQIQKFYIGFYGRPADPQGLEYWSQQALDTSWNQIRESFASSPEAQEFVYKDTQTGEHLQDRELVQNIYDNLFGREPEEQGLEFYQEGLESGRATAAEIVQQIIDGASGQDLEILENKLELAMYFTDHLGDADYQGKSGITAGREVLAGRITDEDLPQAKLDADLAVQDLRDDSEDGIYPTDYEQYMLTLINRARQDPEAEAEDLGVDLNAGLEDGEISPNPKQPLAFSPELTEAAREHSEWMLQEDTFGHTGAGNSDPGERMIDAGYVFEEPWAWGENLAWQGSQQAHDDYTRFIQDQHESLFHSSGHRKNTMQEVFREAGPGIELGEYKDYFGPMTSISFARSGDGLFLTGTVYEDQDDSGGYSPGEGLGGVMVQAGDEATTTWDSGGYALELPAGAYEVSFSAEDWSLDLSQELQIKGQNVLLDAALDTQTKEADLELFNPAENEVELLGTDPAGSEELGLLAG